MTTRKRTAAAVVAPVPDPPDPPEDPSVERPPSNLSPAAAKWWRHIVSTFELEEWHCLLLSEAAAARKQVSAVTPRSDDREDGDRQWQSITPHVEPN